jgi:hypothetical protein
MYSRIGESFYVNKNKYENRWTEESYKFFEDARIRFAINMHHSQLHG